MKSCNRKMLMFVGILASFITLHALIIQTPGYIFDEVHYDRSASVVLGGEGELRPEHPPLAQLFITLGILLLGPVPYGWRFFSVVFGSLTLIFIFLLVRLNTKNDMVSLAAVAILSFESMFFIFSMLGVLDIFMLGFLAGSVYLFQRGNFATSGLMFALAGLSKLSALFLFPIFPILFVLRQLRKVADASMFRKTEWFTFGLWLGVGILSFISLLYVFDQFYAGFGPLSAVFSLDRPPSPELEYYVDPMVHLKYMVSIHASSNWPKVEEAAPWLWLLIPKNYFLGHLTLLGEANPIEGLSPAVTWLAFITMPLAAYQTVKKREMLSSVGFAWFSFAYLPWIAVSLLFPRPIFQFYILTAIPAIVIINVKFCSRNQWLLTGYVFFNILYFLLFQYPLRLLI